MTATLTTTGGAEVSIGLVGGDAFPVDASRPSGEVYCGLSLPSPTYPRNVAPAGSRQNVMSYDTDERRSYFSAGYETSHRQILDCWKRSSGL